MRLLVLMLAIILAGCAASPNEPTPAVADQPSPSHAPDVPAPSATVNGTIVPATPGPPASNWTTFVVTGRLKVSGPLYGPETRFGYGDHAAYLYLPAETSGVVLELVWNDSVLDLDVEFIAPTSGPPSGFPAGELGDRDGYYSNREGRIGAPDSPSRLRITPGELSPFQDASCQGNETPDAGECNVWDVAYRTKEGGIDVTWTLYATVFLREPAPVGFSAVPTSP